VTTRDLANRRQDIVLRALRDAGDRPVSLPELRERGIVRVLRLQPDVLAAHL
jgi:hypothetical protein